MFVGKSVRGTGEVGEECCRRGFVGEGFAEGARGVEEELAGVAHGLGLCGGEELTVSMCGYK